MLKFWTCVALTAVAASCSSANESALDGANRPKAYQTICKQDETCTVSRETKVAFGASGSFVYRVLKGTFLCAAETFGSDPAPAKKVKECSIPLDENTPVDFIVQAIRADGKVELNWNVREDSKGFMIMRDTDGEADGRIRIATLSGTASSYTDASVKDGTQYWYWVKSQRIDDSLVESEPVSINNDECRAGATIKDKTIDCGGKTIGLSCNADSESQPPVMTLINASVKNLRIAANGGSDGIHCNAGDCTLENVVWEDICEDAATNKSEGGTMTIIGGSAYNDATGPGGKPDKIFQHNSKNSTTVVKGGFTVKGQHGKLWRSCGDCRDNGGPRSLVIDDVIIEGIITAGVAGANRNYGDRVKIRNLKIKNYKTGKPAICDEYTGVEKGQGSSTKLGEFFNSITCDVSPGDAVGF